MTPGPGSTAGQVRLAVRSRYQTLRVIVIGALATLGLYLFFLQVVKGLEFERRANSVARRTIPIPAQRGTIYDSSYTRPLVTNRPAFSIDVIPGEVPSGHIPDLFSALAEVLSVSPSYLAGRVAPEQEHLFQPIEVMSGASFATVAYLGEHITHYPGVAWHSETVRDYRELGSLAHIVGYVGDITAEELQILYNRGYTRNDTIGKSGVEKSFDEALRGRDGVRFDTVDARERSLGFDQAGDSPWPGADLILTLDTRVQRLAERALGKRIGSIVVVRPSTGEIVAMVSYPWFDPNSFRGDGGSGEIRRLSLDPSFPFINRAIQSAYPPASVFKLVMTAAVLEVRALNPIAPIMCRGFFEYGDRTFHDHKLDGHGPVDLRHALAESCDIYYYTAGEALGVTHIAHFAEAFGLGGATAVDLPGEVAGFVPTPAWKQRTRNVAWVGGDTINLSIGQGFITATPLQMANVVAAFVNDGVVFRPHAVKEVRSSVDGSLLQRIVPTPILTVDLDQSTFDFVREAMRFTITDGTPAVALTTPAVRIAGKTGTSEVGVADRFHSWFASYAPADAPVDEQLVVVVMVEAANEWEWWAPKAANILFHSLFSGQSYEAAVVALRPISNYAIQTVD